MFLTFCYFKIQVTTSFLLIQIYNYDMMWKPVISR